MSRHVTESPDPRSRFGLYRLCDCPTCEGKGKESFGYGAGISPKRCPDCRGEGRIREEVVSTDTEEGVGVALVTCAREGEWEGGCPFGLLDRTPECETCGGDGRVSNLQSGSEPCSACKGTGIKPSGTWLVLPWSPSARNVTDAARTLARSKKSTP